MKVIFPLHFIDGGRTKIYVGDCREVMRHLSAKSVDLIFADPPFNIGVKYSSWQDDMEDSDYISFTKEWLDECCRLLNDRGSIWVNVPDAIAAEVVMHLKQSGMHMINWCIWHYRFGQHNKGKFINSKTHALYFAKDRKNRVWNHESILEPSDRSSIYKDSRTEETETPGMRTPLDVWYGKNWGRIQGNNLERRHAHPNQLPEVYLRRVILGCSNKGDLVLDPFVGSGTTCTVARALGRCSIGIDISREVADSAADRTIRGVVRPV